MPYKFEEELREKAKSFTEALAGAGFEGAIVPDSFRDYLVKVSVQRAGQHFGHVNLYYSPKKDQFSLKTHELRDKAVIPDLGACWDLLSPPDVAVAPQSAAAPGYQAYVDGSYMDEAIGYGVIILKDGHPVVQFSGPVEDETLQGMRQVGGELQAIYETVEWCRANGIRDVTVYYDYEGVEKWATGAWRGNNPATQAYAAQMQSLPIAVRWQKVQSHSGDRWNERADDLAKRGARAGAVGPEAERAQDPPAALGARVEGFVLFLRERGVDGTYQGIRNDQFARVAVAPSGYMDVYNTRKRSPSQPYLHGFRDKALQGTVEGLWQEYYEGRTRESDRKEAWLEEVTYYFEILKPYRDCAFDFGDLALALDRAYRHSQRAGIDAESCRYSFEKLEAIYCTLKEETETS